MSIIRIYQLLTMKLRQLFLCVAIMGSLLTEAQKIHPITQAMLDGYAQILKENPDDYFTLYQRSQQYYQLSLYDNALDDIRKAIAVTPPKEKDMLAMEYAHEANIRLELKDYEQALTAINAALEYSPQAYPIIYAKGNICLHLNDLETAKSCFRQMQMLKSRSQEAFFGLARVAILQGDISNANSLMKEAEYCDPSNYLTYCRLGDLCKDMKDYDKAATNYLSAFGLSSGKDRPLNSLLSLAQVDYYAVKNAIDFAISKTPNTIPLFFLEGNIALQNGRYHDAYEAYRHLIDTNEGKTASIYAQMAQTCMALNRIPEAKQYINSALTDDRSVDNLIIKSKIEFASGNLKNALMTATEAVNGSERQSVDALTTASLVEIELGNVDNALNLLNEAVMIDAFDLYPLMLRAYIYDGVKGDLRSSVADYQRASAIDAVDMPSLMYKSLAQTMAGKKLDGDFTMNNAVKNQPTNAAVHYYAAVYYAQTGSIQRAKECIDKAIELGFENEYLLHNDRTANLSLAPIRHLF